MKVVPIKRNGRTVEWRLDVEGKKSQLFLLKSNLLREMERLARELQVKKAKK